MKNKILIKFDKQGRLKIPSDLMSLANLCNKIKVFLVSEDNGAIGVINSDSIKNKKVIAQVSIDEKGRFVFPTRLREDTEQVEIFFRDGEIVIKEDSD